MEHRRAGDRELIQKISLYLTHSDIRDRIATAGFNRTAADHTYEKRLASVLNFALWAKNADKPAGAAHPVHSSAIDMPFQSDPWLHSLRKILVWVCQRIWGYTRGVRAARRIVFEISRRLVGEKTFSRSGWPARMFPEL